MLMQLQPRAAIPCWKAFIDGTARAICRPSEEQETYYSDTDFHCVKYQSVVTPDGLTVSLMGVFEGRRHDAGIFRESGFYGQLGQKARFENSQYVVFGDQAYGIRELLLCPYLGKVLTSPATLQCHYDSD
ncbi:hypothetical protein NQ315_003287 [Exocentrus adspersus]|uniref:DDE Tnp4 domain-containing protein n=1 Tax=Exocentrus adspersus TaxID=1586481 RepID=A0AAV8V5L7_9CUCU|nr:hypothetical protein NQ315_003287 [Exocentrus adspersus]